MSENVLGKVVVCFFFEMLIWNAVGKAAICFWWNFDLERDDYNIFSGAVGDKMVIFEGQFWYVTVQRQTMKSRVPDVW